jgi:hypothetical protein
LAVGVRAILTHVSKHFVGRHHGSHLDVKWGRRSMQAQGCGGCATEPQSIHPPPHSAFSTSWACTSPPWKGPDCFPPLLQHLEGDTMLTKIFYASPCIQERLERSLHSSNPLIIYGLLSDFNLPLQQGEIILSPFSGLWGSNLENIIWINCLYN